MVHPAVVLAFFLGGVLFVAIEYLYTRLLPAKPASEGSPVSLGLYIGILVDLVIDGVVIGVGSTLNLKTGLLLALGHGDQHRTAGFCDHCDRQTAGHAKETPAAFWRIYFLVCIAGGAILGLWVAP